MIIQNLPAYLYQQYSFDPTTDDLQAFFTAYNNSSQTNLDTINNLNLPIYTNPIITGVLLDWVALGIYGVQRPALSAGSGFSPLGVYDTVPLDTTAYTQNISSSPATFYTVTDDYFKRILTWNFYKGDGFQYTTNWLKRRVQRFIYGVNGTAPLIDNTYNISVTYTSGSAITIHVSNLPISPILNAGIQDGVLNVPFQYNYTITY